MPAVYHGEEQDVYGELLVMRRRIDDLERSARRWPISLEDGAVIVTGDFTVISDFSVDGTMTVAGDMAVTGSMTVVGDMDVTGSATFGTDSLEVGGGPVRAIAVKTFSDQISNVSLTTSNLEVISIDLVPPSWAEEMMLSVITNSQISASAAQNLRTDYTIDSGGTPFAGAEQSQASGETGNFSNPTTVTHGAGGISLPDACSIDFNADLNTGTNSSNVFRMSGFVFWMRAP